MSQPFTTQMGAAQKAKGEAAETQEPAEVTAWLDHGVWVGRLSFFQRHFRPHLSCEGLLGQ